MRRVTTIGFIAVVLGVLGYFMWQANNTPERVCQRARWQARGSWEDVTRELAALNKRLTTDDALMMESGQLSINQAGRWRMWRTAQNQAAEAVTDSYEDPTQARKAAIKASAACRTARETSPSIQRSGAEKREYTPGGRALKACSQAARVSEEVWQACSFQVAEFSGGGVGLDEVDLDFFSGCDG